MMTMVMPQAMNIFVETCLRTLNMLWLFTKEDLVIGKIASNTHSATSATRIPRFCRKNAFIPFISEMFLLRRYGIFRSS
jgi:hypothetical protein